MLLVGTEEPIALAKVPEVVRKAADKAVPKAKWTEAFKDKDDEDKVFYVLEGKNAKGRGVTVEVWADGEVSEIATAIPFAEVPAVVTAALKKKLPTFKADHAFEMQEDEEVTGYEFVGHKGKGKKGAEMTVFVSADGETVDIIDE